jgi:hypothetical protein
MIDDYDMRVMAALYGACLIAWLWELQEVDERMKARIAQLVARYVGVALTALAAKAGADVDVSGPSEAIALGAVALAMFLYDLWTHRKQADVVGVKTNVIGAAKRDD